ncbi:MAG TPA: hypothetical protein VGL02_16365 [Streptomyces sp.]
MTHYADRNARIRAYRAAYPGITFTAAARHVDAAAIAARLAALPPGPLNTLAGLLTALPRNDEALRVADSLARHLTPDPEAARLAQATEAAYAAMMGSPAGLPARERRALEEAFDAAQDAQGWHLAGHDPYSEEQFLLRAVATALRAAAGGQGAQFAGAAADVLDTFMLDFTADAIRSGGRDCLGTIPATAAQGATALNAQAALRALSAAAETPIRGDEEWTACIRLLEQARDLARAASRTEQGGAG